MAAARRDASRASLFQFHAFTISDYCMLMFHQETMMPLHSSCSRSSSKFPTDVLGVALVLLLCLTSSTGSCTDKEKSSLLQFLAGLSQDGGLAVSWRNDTDCCTWEGITCNTDATITHVSLASKGLEGIISPSLGDLTGLLHLNLSHNSLSGGFPLEALVSSSSVVVLDVSFNQLNGGLQELPSLTTIRPLQVLNISTNLFTGQFPSTTWQVMNNLVALNASNNSFTGQIPNSFCINAPSFAVLDLSFNRFSGSVPPELGKCSMLRVLKAGHNHFNGSLPDELFNATLLEYLSFPNNDLSGVLHGAHIIKLRKLSILDLGCNMFSGKIPNSIGQLKRLGELHLDQNNFSGDLPSDLGNCTDIITIDLSNNQFSGDLYKVNFSSLSKLRIFYVLMNNLYGTIPESIYACTSLTALRLAWNNFHGELSPKMGNLRSLAFLSVGHNAFTNITNALHILKGFRNLTVLLLGGNFQQEVLPEDETIDGFENLQYLGIAGSSLFGKMPLWLSKVTNLQILELSSNQLTGSVPAWINKLNFLFHLGISNNSLTGEFPTTLMQMPMLKSNRIAAHLDARVLELPMYSYPYGTLRQYSTLRGFPTTVKIAKNGFTGVIPPEIGELKGLDTLDLSFNNLSGAIPKSICNLTNLRALDLSSNHLTGALPEALKNLHFLSAFNVSNNDLEGPIPTGGQFDTFQSSSFDGNPNLCGPMLIRHCDSAVEVPASRLSTKQCSTKLIFFAVAFGVFFGVGVLLDQMVLSRLIIFQF